MVELRESRCANKGKAKMQGSFPDLLQRNCESIAGDKVDLSASVKLTGNLNFQNIDKSVNEEDFVCMGNLEKNQIVDPEIKEINQLMDSGVSHIGPNKHPGLVFELDGGLKIRESGPFCGPIESMRPDALVDNLKQVEISASLWACGTCWA
ncbi:hypothetical protein ACOSP7_014657 [Xanthoceras sorbifolium]